MTSRPFKVVSKSNLRLAREIDSLAGLETEVLRKRWAELYEIEPAPRISRDVLIRGVAYRLQENAHGGLSKPCRRQLKRLAEDLRDSGSIPRSPGQTFKSGTKLIREWKGKAHEVIIMDDGYVWGGKHYRSLSQIARTITGTRWSGPRFFGLEAEKQAAAQLAAKEDGRKGAESVARGSAGVADG